MLFYRLLFQKRLVYRVRISNKMFFARFVRHLTLGKGSFKHVIKQRNLMNLQTYCGSSFYHLNNEIHNRKVFCSEQKAPTYLSLIIFPKRYKFKKTPKVLAEEKDEESDSDLEDNQTEDPGSKIITGRMLSLRVDTALKSGLGLPRNKVETLFYENKILVNGEKISKKSTKLEKGDEVDVIKGDINDKLNASRVVILSIEENDNSDGVIVKMKRYKHITIEKQDL